MDFRIYEDGSGQLYLLKTDLDVPVFLGWYDHLGGLDLLHDVISASFGEFASNLLLDEDFVNFYHISPSLSGIEEWLSSNTLVADNEGMYVGDMNGGAREEFCGEKLPFWLSLYNVLDVARM